MADNADANANDSLVADGIGSFKMEAYFIDDIAVDPARRVWDWHDS